MSSEPSNAPPTPSTSTGGTRSSPRPRVHEVTFISYPKLLFTWPLILTGFILWPIMGWFPPTEAGGPSPWAETISWLYLGLMFLVFMTLGVDVDRNQAIFWIVTVLLIWIGSAYLESVKSIPLLGAVFAWFDSLDIYYDRNFGLALSIVLLIPFLVMLAWAWLDDRWRITHNEFEHYSFGRMDDSLGRGAKTIRTSYPDVFEMLLGLAGTLIVYNATGTKELRRIPHVMFLPFVRKRLNKILEHTAIITTAAEMEDDEDDAPV